MELSRGAISERFEGRASGIIKQTLVRDRQSNRRTARKGRELKTQRGVSRLGHRRFGRAAMT
jgi:hypothetical protein